MLKEEGSSLYDPDDILIEYVELLTAKKEAEEAAKPLKDTAIDHLSSLGGVSEVGGYTALLKKKNSYSYKGLPEWEAMNVKIKELERKLKASGEAYKKTSYYIEVAKAVKIGCRVNTEFEKEMEEDWDPVPLPE